MSIHRSLVPKNTLTRQRNVLSRTERILKLQEDEKWKDHDTVYGLPKVKIARVKKKTKVKEEAPAAATTEAATAASETAGTAAPESPKASKDKKKK